MCLVGQSSFSVEHFTQLLALLHRDETLKMGTTLWLELRTWLVSASKVWQNLSLTTYVCAVMEKAASGK